MRTCTMPGCDKAHQARGLCSTHYNQAHQPNRHVSVERVCECCEVTYLTLRTEGRFCSLLCRDYTRWGPRFSLIPVVPVVSPKPPAWHEDRQCLWCGAAFVAHRHDHVNCTRRCKHKAVQMRRRGRESLSGGTYTWTEVMRLFLLFDRRCAYCEQPVIGQPDPDHVVPLSRGGSNSITNILPSCRTCNSDKRDLLLTEWSVDRARRGLPMVTTSWAAMDSRLIHLTSISSAA